MALAVKLTKGAEVHRKRYSRVGDVTFEDIQAFACSSFGPGCYVARYADEDGDHCTLTALTLPDALELGARAGGVLRLEVAPVASSSSSSSSWASTSAAEEEVAVRASTAEAAVAEEDDTRSVNSERSGGAEWVVIGEDEAELSARPAQQQPPPSSEECSFQEVAAAASQLSAVSSAGLLQVHTDCSSGSPEVADMDGQPAASSTSILEAHMAGSREASDDALTTWDHISFVLAAFDADADGRLSQLEYEALQLAGAGDTVDAAMYRTLCEEFGTSPRAGLGPEELAAMYDRSGTLKRDFQASQRKLQQACQEDREDPGKWFAKFVNNLNQQFLDLQADMPQFPAAAWLGLGAPVAALLAARCIR